MHTVLYGLMIAQWAWQVWVDSESTKELVVTWLSTRQHHD